MKKFKIRTSASLKKILERQPRNEREQFQYYYLKGIYDSRIFGLCIYRLRSLCDFKNLIIYRVSGSVFIDHDQYTVVKELYGHNTFLQAVKKLKEITGLDLRTCRVFCDQHYR